jgi:uridine kinase
MSVRAELLDNIASKVRTIAPNRTTRIAIDGVDGAGKTTFADELAQSLLGGCRPVIRASVDGFHNPRVVRYVQGKQSPSGFFEDSYNYSLLKAYLLEPLAPDGNGRYRIAAFDHVTDQPVLSSAQQADPRSILLVDGIFLHRPELRPYWDASIFLRVDFATSVKRNAARDGTSPDPLASSNQRYVQGQRIYLRTCTPEQYATWIIDNNDLAAPFVVNTVAKDV